MSPFNNMNSLRTCAIRGRIIASIVLLSIALSNVGVVIAKVNRWSHPQAANDVVLADYVIDVTALAKDNKLRGSRGYEKALEIGRAHV